MLRYLVAWLAIANRDCMWLRDACVPKVVCLGFEACDHVSGKCFGIETSETCHSA